MSISVIAAIGMGANLGDAPATLAQAAHALNRPHIQVVKLSRLYRSIAIGPAGQPDYANAVALVSTDLKPLDLLDQLQAVELQFGRTRSIRWGARTLDLDLLLYDQQQIHHDRLTVPHAELLNRNFVLWPLADVLPALILGDNQSIQSHCQRIGQNGLYLWSEAHWPPTP